MSEGIISVVLFFSMREVKSNTTTLTKSSHHALYFFLYFYFLLSLKMRGTFFLTTVPQSTEKSERRKLFFSDFPTTTRACVGAFPFFLNAALGRRSCYFSLHLLLDIITFNFFFFLSTFNYFSLVFFSNSLAHSLSLTHLFNVLCAMSVEIFFIFTANNILL